MKKSKRNLIRHRAKERRRLFPKAFRSSDASPEDNRPAGTFMREGGLELLKIQKALAKTGYYAYSAEMLAGHPVKTIHVRLFREGYDDELIRRDEEVLASLPDNAAQADWEESYREWKP